MKHFLKTNKYMLALATVLMVSACSEQEENITTPQFPNEVKEMVVEADSAFVMNFNANMDWRLSSDRMWCQFDSVDNILEVKGKAGKQAVEIFVTKTSWGFEEEQARLTLEMDGVDSVIALVTRLPQRYEVKVSDADGAYDETRPVVLGYNGEHKLQVEGNFDYILSTNAEWLDMTDQEGEVTLMIKDEFVGSAIDKAQDSLFLKNKADEVVLALHVQYAGIDPSWIDIQGTQWGWRVSENGKTFKVMSQLEGQESTVKDSVVFQLSALENRIKFVCATIADSLLYPDEATFMHVACDEQGKAIVTADAFNALSGQLPRTAMIFAFPEAVYDTALVEMKEANVDAYLAKYTNYAMMEVTQDKEEVVTGITVKMQGWQAVKVTDETDETWLLKAQAEYLLESAKVKKVKLQAGVYYVVNPQLTIKQWNPSDQKKGGTLYAVDSNGVEHDAQEFEFESSCPDDKYFEAGITALKLDIPYMILFMDSNKVAQKALVVYPKK